MRGSSTQAVEKVGLDKNFAREWDVKVREGEAGDDTQVSNLY